MQERLTVLHGSQCGFCTPGIIMAMYTLFRNTPNLNSAEMREHMDGNLCRCTGYRPILDAGMSLCADGGCCEMVAAAAAAAAARRRTQQGRVQGRADG